MGRVITVQGYKAFRGTIKILHLRSETEEIYGDWLYTPATNQWHCGDKSYDADRCMVTAVEQAGAITVKGYKMFTGILRATPPGERPGEIYGNWLYNPKTDHWYGDFLIDYPADICKIVG